MIMIYEDFLSGDCELYNSSSGSFAGLWGLTHGDPCTTGCAWYKDGDCTRYKQAISRQKAKPIFVSKPTNAELSQELGISKRQVSKMRKNGMLEEAMGDRRIYNRQVV